MSPKLKASSLLEEGRDILRSAGVEDAQANAEFIMAFALKIHRGELRARMAMEAAVSPESLRCFQKLVGRRAKRIPLGYVLGTQEFMGHEFCVTSQVLVPRPETEQLVEAAEATLRRIAGGRSLKSPGAGAARILDIGTGCGCIAITLALRWPNAQITALDCSRRALEVASGNARRLGVGSRIHFLHQDISDRLPASMKFDLVVSNPPYIPSARIARLSLEVLQEPRLALDGGNDGLKVIRTVVDAAARVCSPAGVLMMEIDEGQGAAVCREMKERGFLETKIMRDFGGLERIAMGQFN